MPYHIGEKGSYGCSGYPVVKDGTGEVMGCHDTASAAQAQISAINMSEAEKGKKKMTSALGQPYPADNRESFFNWSTPVRKPERSSFSIGKQYEDRAMGPSDARIKEGDYVMGQTVDGVVHGRVEHIMWEGGVLGAEGEPYSLRSMPPENPAMSVRVFEEEDDEWVPTPYSIGMMYQDAQIIDPATHTMSDDEDDDDDDDMEYMYKAETYTPNSGMKAAARRALRWKEEGKATGAGTPVGWGRATDIVAGRPMSLSVVRRMFSFFSRHEVDKKGKDFYNTSNPSNGRIMWDAWGGDAGFSWSRAIVERNKEKALGLGIFNFTDVSKVKEEYGVKRERTMETRRRLAESGQAMEDGSYPIVTVEDLRNAIQAVGRAKNYEAARRHIIRRARALGRTDLLPEEWSGQKFWDINDLTKTENFVVKADSVRVGQMVSWNSSGGRAQGKVTRIIRNGSYNVPNSDFVINGTEENPAVVITLYRDGEPTDTTVAHRMSTLRAV